MKIFLNLAVSFKLMIRLRLDQHFHQIQALSNGKFVVVWSDVIINQAELNPTDLRKDFFE